MKQFVITILCIISSTILLAQGRDDRQAKKEERREKINQLIKQEEEGALIFHKQSVFGIKLVSDGYGAFYELGRLKTPLKTNLYFLEIGERKHPKEEKLSRPNFGQAVGNPYIFGKINNFYYAKLGLGQQRLIGGKANKNGVAVSAIYGGGFSAGLLKPYYLQLNNSAGDGEVKYNGSNDSIFLSPSSIFGAAGFGKGFGEMKFVPGAFARAALRFDYGRFNETVSALEVGVNAEFYTKTMPIILYIKELPEYNKPKRFFINVYASILFGRRK